MANPLVEDLQGLLRSQDAPAMPVVTIATDPNYVHLRALLDAIMHSPAMGTLTADELRALNTFIITVTRCATQSPPTARGEIGAVWRSAESGIIKLPIGLDVRRTIHSLMLGSNA